VKRTVSILCPYRPVEFRDHFSQHVPLTPFLNGFSIRFFGVKATRPFRLLPTMAPISSSVRSESPHDDGGRNIM